MVELVNQNFSENKKIYEDIEVKLKNLLGENVSISHVGSTAIPNIQGKNIIDILVGAKDESEFKEFIDTISNMGYHPSSNSRTDIYQFFASKLGETGSGDIHIHLVMMGTERYDEFLILRDYLLECPEEATNYSNYKQEMINSGIIERKEYKRIKGEYVTALIQRAKEYHKRKNR